MEASGAAWGTILMTGLVSLAVISVLVQGLLSGREVWDIAAPGLLARAKKRRERILRAIKDADLERQAGTLSEAEFNALRAELKSRAIAATKALEHIRLTRVKNLMRQRRNLTPSQRKHIEELVRQRAERKEAPGIATKGGPN